VQQTSNAWHSTFNSNQSNKILLKKKNVFKAQKYITFRPEQVAINAEQLA